MFTKLSKKESGFTIVELLIVIVVIGILAALVLNTFQGVQARARDTERRTDVNVIATQLEVYHSDYGYYPDGTTAADATSPYTSCGDGDQEACTLSTTTLPGLDGEALNSPTGDTGVTVSANPAAEDDGPYYYDITGATCTNAHCDSFVLSTDLESESGANEVYSKTSLN